MKWNTPQNFLEQTINKAIDMDGYPASQKYQCWDYGDYFWVNQVGRTLITKPGGNGSARDCWTVSKKVNAGSEFDLITNKNDLQCGDWVIFNNGKNGHIGIVKSVVKKGVTVNLQGENQGSWKVNVIQRNLGDFLGAFRYKQWAYSKKSNDQIADEVIKGLWGNGETRKQRLTNAGYNYNTIQKLVNQKLQGSYTPSKKTNEEVAREVIQGKWGNGKARKNNLEKAGYDYNKIQSIVNQMLR